MVLQMQPKSLMDSEKTKQHNSKSTNNNKIHVPYAVTTEQLQNCIPKKEGLFEVRNSKCPA